MNQLMESLFSTLELTKQSETEAQAVKAAEEAVQAAEQRLSRREFDQLWNAIVAIDRACELDCFIKGFRLGFQLSMEGLRPVYPD